jgi:histidine ammonia-lyase
MSASRRLAPMLRYVRDVLAIELLAACQGIDFYTPLQSGIEARKAYALVRGVSSRVTEDRALASDINAVSALIGLNGASRFSEVVRSLV